MKLPVVAYGMPVLRKKGKAIDKDYPGLQKLIDDMFETMYASEGVGLAAPQIDKSIRLFVVDAEPFGNLEGVSEQEKERLKGKRVFINAKILEETGKEWSFTEVV